MNNMELWIRSQNKDKMTIAQDIRTGIGVLENLITVNGSVYGAYKDNNRCEEILNEIQNKIKNSYIVSFDGLVRSDTIKRIQSDYFKNIDGEFIIQPPQTNISPINPRIIVYEMPEK